MEAEDWVNLVIMKQIIVSNSKGMAKQCMTYFQTSVLHIEPINPGPKWKLKTTSHRPSLRQSYC